MLRIAVKYGGQKP